MRLKKILFNKTFNNTLMLYLLTAAKMVFPLITLPYLTRVLSVDSYGMVSYTKAIIGYAQTIIDFGFILSSVKDIVLSNNEKTKIAEIISNTIFAKLLISVLAFIVVIILCFTVPAIKGYTFFVLLSFVVPFLSSFLLDFFFRGIEKMHFVTIVYVATKIVSTLLTVLFVKNDGSMILIPVFDIASSVIAIFVSWGIAIYMGYKLISPKISKSLHMIKESFNYFANSIVSTAFSSLNTIIIGIAIPDLNQVAYWSVSMQLVGAIQSLYTPISNGIYPHMIKEKNLNIIKKIHLYLMPVVIVGSAFCYFFASNILVIISGKQYYEASSVFKTLVPVLIISFPVAILGWPTLGAIGKNKEVTISTIVGAITQIMGLFFLFVMSDATIISIAIIRNFSELAMLVVRLYFVIINKNNFMYNKSRLCSNDMD